MFIDLKRTDNDGNMPTWHAGERVIVPCVKDANNIATVVKQQLCYDMGDCFWGNVFLRYDDGASGYSNSWQCIPIHPQAKIWKGKKVIVARTISKSGKDHKELAKYKGRVGTVIGISKGNQLLIDFVVITDNERIRAIPAGCVDLV